MSRAPTHYDQATLIAIESRRLMLTDLCTLVLVVAIAWIAIAILRSDVWDIIIANRQPVLGNMALLLGLSATTLLLLRGEPSVRTVQRAGAIFVAGCFAVTALGVTFSGYGVRALSFHLLLLVLTFVTFHYGSQIAKRYLFAVLGTLGISFTLEKAGVVTGATPAHQPLAFVAMSVSSLTFLILHALYKRFEERFSRLGALYTAQSFELRGSLLNMNISLRRKAAFARLLSHSTRTPLAGIRFAVDLLQRRQVPAEVFRRTLTALQRHAYRLQMMIVHLDMAKRLSQAHPQDWPTAHVNLHDVRAHCLQVMSPEASQQGISVVFTEPARASIERAPLDAGHITSIVLMLADNAIKLQRGGTLTIDLREASKPAHSSGAQGDGSGLLIEVIDEGPGIAQTDAARLFRPLGESAPAAEEDVSAVGLSLGLPTIRTLCDRIGGECGYRARETGGSVFWVWLRADRQAVPPQTVTAPRGRSIEDTSHAAVPAANAPSFTDQANRTVHKWQAVPNGIDGAPHSDVHTARLIRIYATLMLLAYALSLTNFGIQAYHGSDLARQAFLNSASMFTLTLVSLWLGRSGHQIFAVSMLLLAILLGTFNATLLIGMGPRAPALLMMGAAIPLAHFQFGPRGGLFVTIFGVVLAIVGYLLESASYLPGIDGELFPPAINSVVVLTSVYILSFITALEMQGRSEVTLNAMRDRNTALELALAQAVSADRSQNHFIDSVSPAQLAKCRQLAQLCSELSGSVATIQHDATRHALLTAIARLNDNVSAGFDAAVTQVEQGQKTPPAGLHSEPALTSNGLDTPSNLTGAA